jgi:dTMP kinase
MCTIKYPGKLVVFEGTDGTGKTTQCALLGEHLKKLGYETVVTKEPTDGPFGMQIRDLYRNRQKYSREEELELFLADRKQHVKELIEPCLEKGKIVLCDRYYYSTAAYQGALGLDPLAILAMNDFAPQPDLVLLFQTELDIGLKRITKGRGEQLNCFEQRNFLEKVADIFMQIKNPTFRIIDASAGISEVQQIIIGHVMKLLQLTAMSAMQD